MKSFYKYWRIDTAAVYRNEAEIGIAIHDIISSGAVTRKDLFITSKICKLLISMNFYYIIAPKHQGYEKAYLAVLESIQNFGPSVGYIDLMLIHWPGTQGILTNNPQNQINRHATYKALERLYQEGKVRAIGVSNFMTCHLDALLQLDLTVIPHVNQFEFHPLLWSDKTQELFKKCILHGIVSEAYSCLGEGKLVDESYQIPQIDEIASRLHATRAQVLIKWSMLKGCVVIPKSSSTVRLLENLNAINLALNPKDIEIIDHLVDEFGETRFCWDPNNVV